MLKSVQTSVPVALFLSGLFAFQIGCVTDGASLSHGAVVTKDQQAIMTPDSVLADLKAGNDRFVAGETLGHDLLAQARATAAGQYPKAIVLGCVDSRVPPEMVFDQGIGDIFVSRVAGNFENRDILGSMEFSTIIAGAKLVVVLGHESCGAVKGAIDEAVLGNLTATLANIVVDTSDFPGERSSKIQALVAAVAEANVRQTIQDIHADSPDMARLVSNGELKIVGAIYSLETGRVHWLELDS